MRIPFNPSTISGAIGLVLTLAATGALADPMDFYAGPAITDAMKADPRACLNVGDAVSCSAGMLNLISQQLTGTTFDATGSTGLSETNATKIDGYIIAPSGQGQLKQAIVLGSGGEAANPNGTIDPLASQVQDGFKTNNAGYDYAATGKTGTTAGNLGVAPINSLNPAFDQAGTWDVDLNWLISALTLDAQRRELMIGFDYNQAQAGGTVDYWSLITVIDYQRDANGNVIIDPLTGKGAIANQINYEIKNDYISGYAGFNSGKTFNSQPDGSEFSSVNTQTCYKLAGGIVTDVVPTSGTCPPGYDSVNNATGDSTTEIIAFLPELNSNLELFASGNALGYKGITFDAISVRMLFGCFDDPKNSKSGTGYLSGGSTLNCDGGGNVDVFLMAGAPMPTNQTPEPGSLALVALSLLGMGAATRRRRIITK